MLSKHVQYGLASLWMLFLYSTRFQNKSCNHILLSCATEDVCDASSRLSVAKTATRWQWHVFWWSCNQWAHLQEQAPEWAPNWNVFIYVHLAFLHISSCFIFHWNLSPSLFNFPQSKSRKKVQDTIAGWFNLVQPCIHIIHDFTCAYWWALWH